MKATDIRVGGMFHDGKSGVREVLTIEGAPARVTYKVLAAKVEQEYSHAAGAMVPLIGTTSKCDLTSFAQWAKATVPTDAVQRLLVELAAKKLRLAPGEKAFMASVAREFGDEFPPNAGASVSYDFNETRTARGVAKKGLATVTAGSPGRGGEITLSELGAGWIRLHRAGAIA